MVDVARSYKDHYLAMAPVCPLSKYILNWSRDWPYFLEFLVTPRSLKKASRALMGHLFRSTLKKSNPLFSLNSPRRRPSVRVESRFLDLRVVRRRTTLLRSE